MVNLRLSRRPVQKQKRLRNILLVGTEDREDFLDYLDIDVVSSDKGKNYRWKNRNIMNMPSRVVPRQEVIQQTDVIIYIVDCDDINSFKDASIYSEMLSHVPHHIVIAVNYNANIFRSKFYKHLNRLTEVHVFDDDYEDYELENFLKYITKKVR
jgi:hypothetical protein